MNGAILLPDNRSLQARRITLDSEVRARILSGDVDCSTEAFLEWREEEIGMRHWLSGDRYRPLGAPGSRKLQDLFGDLKIPEAERYRLPVVFFSDKIVWVPGFPPAEVYKINNLTKAVVQLTYNSDETV